MLKKLLPLLLLSSVSQAAETVRIYNWTDYISPDTLKQFEQNSGIASHYDVYDSNETLDAKLMAGRSGYDVVFPSNHYMARQIQGGALKKLDKSRLPGWNNLNPVLMKALETNDPGNQYLPHHSKNPEDYAKAEALLMEMRKNVRYFHSSKYVGDLANGDICMAVGFSGDIMQAGNRAAEANNGISINYVIPKEGTPIWFDMVTMPVDSNNEQAAYAFMNYLLQPEVIAQITNHVQYANGNSAADNLVDPKLKADATVYPPQEAMDNLYALEAMPLKIDRVRTRIWSKVKSGI
jgi:spermidine/putrescine-binding protein